MEVQIKKAIRAGNSSAVVLPKSWIGKEVRVEQIRKSHESILLDVIEILSKNIKLEEVIGIYLSGSYARQEESIDSDIDVLVITSNTSRNILIEGIYSILIISEELLNYKLENDLLPIGQMIFEAKPMINSGYLKKIKVNATKKNVSWYLDTTESKLELIKRVLKKIKMVKKSYVPDSVSYTLILRIRTLHTISNILKDKVYSKNDFLRLIKKISGTSKAYESYLNIKNSMGDNSLLRIGEAQKLYNYLGKEYKKLKQSI